MAIGAFDRIDRMLVKKYAQEKVDNHESMESAVKPEAMMTAMNNSAAMYRDFLSLNVKLKKACSSINTKMARYTTSMVQRAYA